MAFAHDCEVREEAALEQVWDCYNSNFVDLLDHFWQVKRLDVVVSPPFHEMRKIINVSDLRRNGHTFFILRSDLAIVD